MAFMWGLSGRRSRIRVNHKNGGNTDSQTTPTTKSLLNSTAVISTEQKIETPITFTTATETQTMTGKPLITTQTRTAVGGLTSGSAETMTGSELTLAIETFNCNGFKESSDFVINRMSNVDVMCLCETWLKTHENNIISGVSR